jgi:Conserved hypothetical protein 2217 (DUF2460).
MVDYRSNYINTSNVVDASGGLRFAFAGAQSILDTTPHYRMYFTGMQRVVDEVPTYRMYYLNAQIVEEFIPSPWDDANQEGDEMSTEIFPELIGLTFDIKRRPQFNTKVQDHISGKETRLSFWERPKWQFEMSYDYLPNIPKAVGNTDLDTIIGFFLNRKGKFQSFLYRFQDDYQVTRGVIGTGTGSTAEMSFVRKLGAYSSEVDYVDFSITPPAIYWDETANFIVGAGPTYSIATHANIEEIFLVKSDSLQVLHRVMGVPAAADEYFVDMTTGLFTFYISQAGATMTIHMRWKLSPDDYTLTVPNKVVFNSVPLSGTIVTSTFNFFYNVRFMEDESEFNLFADKLYELQELTLQSVPT